MHIVEASAMGPRLCSGAYPAGVVGGIVQNGDLFEFHDHSYLVTELLGYFHDLCCVYYVISLCIRFSISFVYDMLALTSL